MKLLLPSKPKRLATWICLFGCLLAALPLSGAVLARSGTLLVASADAGLGSAFAVGDVFSYTLAYDDAVIDSILDPTFGEFTGALISFTILPITVRPGIWSPTTSMGGGSVYTEEGVPQTWSFDVFADPGFGPTANGYAPAMLYMGFGGLPPNFDTGGGQTLGAVTGSILDSVSMASDNIVELNFELGLDSQLVTFELTNFHAPEPGRLMLAGIGLAGLILQRKRTWGWHDRAAGLGGNLSCPVIPRDSIRALNTPVIHFSGGTA